MSQISSFRIATEGRNRLFIRHELTTAMQQLCITLEGHTFPCACRYMSNLGEVFRFVSNWTTCSTACADPRQFLWVLALRPYSPGGALNALAYDRHFAKRTSILLMNNQQTSSTSNKHNTKIFVVVVSYLMFVDCWFYLRFAKQRSSAHRLRLELRRSLICFATQAFVLQRQNFPRYLPSPLVFLSISTHFTASPTVPVPPRSF